MRLTLRTLLAYLDGILEPSDRDEIARKIDESEFARQLVERLRECARNPNLAAPKVSGKTSSLDPNLVAEYLDNTLAGERVPDFEKVCLESDVYLAEVAACHQILTMVLAQPADIDVEMKELMYGVLNQAAQHTSKSSLVDLPEGSSAALPDDIWVKPQRRKPEIPDYLRESPKRSNWKPIAAGALLLLILVIAIIMALGPLDRTHPIARLLGFGQAPENLANSANASDKSGKLADVPNTTIAHNASPASNGPTMSEQTDNDGGAKAVDSNPAPSSTVASKTTPLSEKSGFDTPSTSQAALPGSSSTGRTTPSTAPVPDAATSSAPVANIQANETGAPRTDSNLVPPPLPQPPAISSDVPAASSVPPATIASNVDATKTDAAHAATPAGTAPPAPGDATVPPADNTPVGRLLPSKDVVLLKFDQPSNQWTRVQSGAAVTAGEQLLVLPTYRPTITLSAGVTLQIPEETSLELVSTNAQGVPTVKLIYGRLVAITSGKAGSQLILDAGGIKGVVTFVDGEATLGVEVHRYYPVGTNPVAEAANVVADLYAARGHLEWTAADGTVTSLTAPQRWVLSANPTEAAAGPLTPSNMPKWIDPEQLRPLDAQASEYLAQSLQEDKPLLVVLGEMVDHRRVEIKSLGTQCLAMLDEFEPLVATFNDDYQRPMWPVEIASVKAALSRGSATATKVHDAFVKQRGEELGTELYRMFLGYTKEQLQNGEAGKLVDFLDHDNLDCRVLAFANLQEVTNKTFNYRPEAPAAARAQPFRRWQEELHNNAIVPRETPQK